MKMKKNPFHALPRIFVVDDELAISKMLAVILQMNLFDATPYTDPQAALKDARANPPEYLISDITMPNMNGIELAIILEREVPTCKVLLFSGQVAATNLIREATEAGHRFDLIQKPVHPTELVAALRRL